MTPREIAIIASAIASPVCYLVMIAGVTAALAGLATGELTMAEAITGLCASLGLGTLRHSIAKK